MSKGERTCLGAACRRAAHKLRASSHAWGSSQKNFDNTGAVVCDSTRASHLCACTGAVKDQKANATLTELNLWNNRVGDGGASALADALKATVLTCKKCVFTACVCFHCKCRFTKSCEELASSTCSAVCVATFVIFLVTCRNTFKQVCGAGSACEFFSSSCAAQ